jgi:CHAT domain-containing protein
MKNGGEYAKRNGCGSFRETKNRIHQQKQKVTGKEVVVIGNPTMPRIGIPPNDYQLGSLGGAEKEASSIATLFKTKPILGKDATKDALLKKLPTAGIIHLATHGLLDDPKQGIPTAIALAPTANDDGLLTIAKILDLKINADLVVLNAYRGWGGWTIAFFNQCWDTKRDCHVMENTRYCYIRIND